MSDLADADRVLLFPEVQDRFAPFSRVHLRRLQDRGDFPAPIHLGARRLGWIESELRAWLAARIAVRDLRAKRVSRGDNR